MDTDANFVQECSRRLGFGPFTAGKSVRQIAKLMLVAVGSVGGKVQIDSADHFLQMLQSSPAGLFVNVDALTTEDRERLFKILLSVV